MWYMQPFPLRMTYRRFRLLCICFVLVGVGLVVLQPVLVAVPFAAVWFRTFDWRRWEAGLFLRSWIRTLTIGWIRRSFEHNRNSGRFFESLVGLHIQLFFRVFVGELWRLRFLSLALPVQLNEVCSLHTRTLREWVRLNSTTDKWKTLHHCCRNTHTRAYYYNSRFDVVAS